MKRRIEQSILLTIAVVSGAAGFGLDPKAAGMILAVLNAALAFCVNLR